ncbi:peroxisomal trans-2-enoyl-CoA reductase isoform X6 [Xiphophorus maculatus]|uniref:peroxisomal trans-2-enoyl-CoA reductase isoform X6 n=1 Tax=Xiphophorus maculatus TaxID=8083 RepID=UPI000C6EEF49|nr:peroxisomal trans-2-enoyl-CoA reductase isoform X6 [Xiphophorus maculatus]
MDEFQKLDVKIPNSVLVEGISDEDGKEEVFDFLKQYGKITKTEIISEADSEFEGQFVVEFSSGTAVAELRSILPYSFKSSEKSDTFFISELAVVYAEHVSQSKTHSYLFELQKLAKLSGMDFAEVLKSTMTQIGQSVAELHSAAKMEDPDEKSEVMAAAADPTMKEEPTLSTATDPTVSRQRLEQQPTSRQRPSLHDDDIQPPEVQRYVVEHIMKTEESAYHLQRLRVFSGRLPRPAHEADYETWHSGVDLLLKDPSVSELQRSRRIVESLLPPAADMLKHLSSDTPPTVYLNILDSAYGTVQDGEELFAKFMDTFQDAGEKPSSYLQRLQVEGAAGQSVPYLGYVELVITFPEDFIGVNTEVPTLALVVPDTSPDRPSNVLIGMNTLEPLYEQHLSSNHVQFQSMAQGYRAVLKLLQLRHQQNQLGNAGTVRLLSTTPVLISPGQTIVLEGSVKNASPSANKWAIVEHPSSPLPGGLCVQSCLITLPQHPPYKVPVIMKNESEQEVFISPLTIIADIGSAPTVLSQQITSQTSQRTILEFNFGDSPIPPEWKEHIINKMNSMPEVFSHHDMDFGCTDAVKHTIKLNDETPFKHRARPIHPQDLEAVREHLRDLFGAGIIRESKSPFSSPIVVVRKRNGSVRLCIDYRKLNLQTIKDAYALPNLEESFCALTGSKWFTVLDLKSGYYQIEMAEEDKAKTAFVTPLGFWEWNRMPQGITNAPSTFQRLMERCMGDLHLKEVLVFLDDIIIFSATLEEHEERLLRVLSRLKQFGLKLSPEKSKLDATGHRWLAALSTYSFQLQYRAGKQNLDADALSRRSHEDISSDQHCRERELIQHLTSQLGNGKNTHDISPEIVDAICQSCIIRTQNQTELSRSVALVESLSVSVNSIPDGFSNEELHGLPLIPSLSQVDLQEQQQADPAIREVIHQLETGEKVLPSVREELSDLPLLLREWNRLELVDGILYRRRHDGDKLIYQLILPPKLRPTVLKSLHHDMGHMGIERTIDLVRQRFFWPKMTLEVETFVRTCGRCIRRKAQIERAAPLINIQTSRPLELLCMDFLTIEPDSSNTKDILVLTDHFTKFAVAIPTPNQKAKTVAKYLWNEFMVYYGIPERIHSDQGTDFESKLIKELCEVVGMKKSRTTPYHPRGNPVERFNRTLLNMLGTLEMKQKSKWREYVKPLVHAYNCTRNVVTGFTPYELMFGRCPRLPVDLAFGLPVREQSSISHSEYVKNLQSSLKESYKLASENALKSAAKNKTRFDQKITPCSLEIGDRVLVRNIRLRGKHKLADRWEPGVYKVVNRAENVPVYTVQPEHKEGPTRTLHRDLLLPCGFLPVCSTEDPSISMPASQRKTRSQDGCHPDVPDAMQEDEDAEPYVPEVSIPSPTRFSVKVRKFESSPESITLQPISPLAQSDAEAPEHPVPLIQSTDLETASPSENEKSCLTTDSSLSHYEDKLPVEQIEAEELSEPHVAEPVKVHMEGEVPDEHLPEVQEPDAEGHLVVQSESSIGPASVSSPYNSIESETLPRRSDRQRQPPSRLTYPVLGQVRCRSLAQGVAGGILTIARIVWFHRPDWQAKISRIPKHKTYHLGTFFRPNWRISSSPH